jgi:multidrug efflux system membrane fusion protein
MKSPISSQPQHKNSNKRTPLHRRLGFWLLLLVVIITCAILLKSCGSSKDKNKRAQTVPIVVAKVKTSNVPVYLNELGGVTPTYSVTVHTQINGTLLKVNFKEGQMVKQGDLLAQIDPRPYQAQLVQYQGQLARDKALLANALVDLKRYQVLWKQDSVSQQVLATQQSLVDQDKGTVKIDQGLIQATQVNLIYCNITSPINGRVGLRLVDPGNYVQTSDTTGIAVLNTLNPITVIFTIPEDDIPQVLDKITGNKVLTVQAYDRQQTTLLDTGKILTIDNQVDPTTGTVKLRATFPNNTNQLFPNQFVNVRLLVKTLKNVLIVPTAAIQYTAKGTGYVYVLNADQTVSSKNIVAGIVSGDNTVITSGVSVGESVVTEGADKLTDGAAVTVGTGKKSTSTAVASRSTKRRALA